MGWSESYYEDMRCEAEREFRRCSLPLRISIEDFQTAMANYRQFSDNADEIEELLLRLKALLPDED